MKQIKQLLSNIYNDRSTIRYRFLFTLTRLDLYEFGQKSPRKFGGAGPIK